MLFPSVTTLNTPLSAKFVPLWRALSKVGIVHILDEGSKGSPRRGSKARAPICTMNNLTILNWLLQTFGPMHERELTMLVIAIQAGSCLLGFFIRYRLVHFVY